MKLKIFILSLTVLGLSACQDFLVEEPKSFLSPSNFPATSGDADLMIGEMMNIVNNQSYYDRAFLFIAESSSDETDVFWSSGDRYEIDYFTYKSDNLYITQVWADSYKVINTANVLSNRLPEEESWGPKYIGTARFFRAWMYFNMVRLYGNLPLITIPVASFDDAFGVERNSVSEVYQLIEEDLKYAEQHLPLTWTGNSSAPDDGRPTLGAAKALLAEVYIHMAGETLNDTGKWTMAAQKAKEVQDLNQYQLVGEYADLWLIANENGPEHIFSVQHTDIDGSVKTVQATPNGGGIKKAGWYFFNTPIEFMNTFSDQDKRKAATFFTELIQPDGQGGFETIPYTMFGGAGNPLTNKPCLKKFIDAGRDDLFENNKRTGMNFPVLRYAEVLLIRAEAENEANGGPNAEAYAAINAVRERADLNPLSGLSQEEFRQAVRQEWSFELCHECKRRFNLQRWGTLQEVLFNDPHASIGFADHKEIYPVPQREIAINPALGQNQGY